MVRPRKEAGDISSHGATDAEIQQRHVPRQRTGQRPYPVGRVAEVSHHEWSEKETKTYQEDLTAPVGDHVQENARMTRSGARGQHGLSELPVQELTVTAEA